MGNMDTFLNHSRCEEMFNFEFPSYRYKLHMTTAATNYQLSTVCFSMYVCLSLLAAAFHISYLIFKLTKF